MGLIKKLLKNDPIGHELFNHDPINEMLFGDNPADQIAGIGPAPAPDQAIAETAPTPVATLMTPTVMPTADSDAQRAARRKSQADQAKRRGRQSTIMTGNDDALGAA